jgi:DNA-binding transcriptional LysR family regulator
MAGTLLPEEIVAFRKLHPRVRFDVRIAGADQVVQSVVEEAAEVGITFNPSPHVDFQPLAEVPQELHAVMSARHPLAGSASLRLRDCQAYPLALGDGNRCVPQCCRTGIGPVEKQNWSASQAQTIVTR